MITIVYDPAQDPIAIPLEVEHAGQAAVDHYVRAKTGFDLAAQRAEGERRRMAAAATAAQAREAAEQAAAPVPDPAIAAALRAAIPINAPLLPAPVPEQE